MRTRYYGWITLTPDATLTNTRYQRIPRAWCHPCRNDGPRARFRRKG